MFAVADLIHVDATMWALIVSVIIPPLVGYLTTISQAPAVKAGLVVFLNLVNAIAATAVTAGSDAVISKSVVVTTVIGYLSSHAVYKDFWKSNGITSSPLMHEDTTGELFMIPGKLSDKGIKGPMKMVSDPEPPQATPSKEGKG